MRNNQDRLGNQFQDSDDSEVNAGIFNYVVPTHIVDLPSKGAYYGPNHPLHGKENVEIKEMTAKEEDILYNKSFLDKGIVMDKLLQSLFLDKSINPATLLVIDKNALLIAARVNGYGADYPINAECPACGSKFEATVDLNNLLKIKEPKAQDGVVLQEDGLVNISLPVTKWKVEVKPLTGIDQDRLQKIIEGKKKHKLEENTIVETIKSFVHSINSVTDDSEIYKAILAMPAKDSKHLRNVYTECFPNVTTDAPVTCTICTTETDMEVPFTLNFFWSK
jgi:hypothetical protein